MGATYKMALWRVANEQVYLLYARVSCQLYRNSEPLLHANLSNATFKCYGLYAPPKLSTA
jgi:hypothetical protein